MRLAISYGVHNDAEKSQTHLLQVKRPSGLIHIYRHLLA